MNGAAGISGTTSRTGGTNGGDTDGRVRLMCWRWPRSGRSVSPHKESTENSANPQRFHKEPPLPRTITLSWLTVVSDFDLACR